MNPSPTEIPPVPSSYSPPPISPPPTGGPPKFSLLPILGVIILITLTTTVAFFLGKSQNSTNSSTPSTPPTPSNPSITPIIPSPTLDTTANWKTYTDTKHNFSFKYPNNLSECCNIAGPASGKAEQIIVFGDKTTTIPGTDAPFDGFSIYVEPNPTKTTFSTYIENEKQALLEQAKVFSGIDNTGKGISQTFTISGKSGIMLKGFSWDNVDRYYITFPDNQKILEISKLKKNTTYDASFDQILRTFKFSENNTTTYTNPNFPGLSIPYDTTWTINVVDTPQTSMPNVKNTIITLSKREAKLTLDLKPAIAFGWGNSCYKNSEIIFNTLTNKWTRYKISNGYIYTTNAYPKGTKEFTSMFDAIVGSTGQSIDDYSICGPSLNESAMAIKSAYILPTNMGGDGTKTMSAIFDIRLTFTGQEDEKLLQEADSIVTKMIYPSPWN